MDFDRVEWIQVDITTRQLVSMLSGIRHYDKDCSRPSKEKVSCLLSHSVIMITVVMLNAWNPINAFFKLH